MINAKFRGARVIVVEPLPYRAQYAAELGADLVLDGTEPGSLTQIQDFTDGRGVDKALECSGVVAAQRFCLEATRRKGQVTFVGECGDELKLRVSPDMIRKGLTIRGSWHYNLSLFTKIMQVIQGSPLIERLISHIFPMSQIQDALELSASQQCAKIMIKPWE